MRNFLENIVSVSCPFNPSYYKFSQRFFIYFPSSFVQKYHLSPAILYLMFSMFYTIYKKNHPQSLSDIIYKRLYYLLDNVNTHICFFFLFNMSVHTNTCSQYIGSRTVCTFLSSRFRMFFMSF